MTIQIGPKKGMSCKCQRFQKKEGSNRRFDIDSQSQLNTLPNRENYCYETQNHSRLTSFQLFLDNLPEREEVRY